MIPDYQSLMRPVLEAVAAGPRKIGDVVEQISNDLGLTSEEREQLLPSGKQTVIANRVHWARSYLKQAGAVSNPKRGWYELTDRGAKILNDPSIVLNNAYLQNFQEFQEFQAKGKGEADTAGVTVSALDESYDTPDESLLAAHAKLNAALAASLIDAVCAASPAFFEQLIVDLLLAMDYGGASENAGKALGQSGDNGIDGVIDQDPLGVDQIYLQAKRYAPGNVVGAGDIRNFFGALSLKKATKGIFVTTSSFSQSAKDTARDLGARIVLIDGPQLARLMIRYNIGCREKDVLRIMTLDEGYFEGEGA